MFLDGGLGCFGAAAVFGVDCDVCVAVFLVVGFELLGDGLGEAVADVDEVGAGVGGVCCGGGGE